MNSSEKRPRKSVLLSFRFLTVSVIGSLAMAIASVYADLPQLIALLGSLISILAGLVLEAIHQNQTQNDDQQRWLANLDVPVTLSSDTELMERYVEICDALTQLADQDDTVLRSVAFVRLTALTGDLTNVANGMIEFRSTETWRTVYEKLLRSPDISKYLSIAWVRSEAYWQDTPGVQSTELNLERAHEGLLIKRIAIINDAIWPSTAALPSNPIERWLLDQHEHGILVLLVRQSKLSQEDDLLIDLGIYGQRAVGYQELDEQCRTSKFTLYFDDEELALANDRWERLEVYATPLWKILDRDPETS